jgi:hypothetical protein
MPRSLKVSYGLGTEQERPSPAINLTSPAEAGMGAEHSFTHACARIFATQAAVHTLDTNRECRRASK